MNNFLLNTKKIITLLFILAGFVLNAQESAQISNQLKWSERMALSIMKRHPESYQIDDKKTPQWDYVHALVLTSFEALYKNTNDQKISMESIRNKR